MFRFDFDNVEAKVIEGVVCPQCGGKIVKTSFGYACEHRNRNVEGSCTFAIGKMAEKDLNESQIKELMEKGRTSTIRGFKGKSGKKFDACVALEKDENGMVSTKFDFDHVEANVVKDVKCPLCGGDIVKTPFGFGCANYAKDNPFSCRFSIGKMAEKDLNEAQVKELLTDGRTSTIRGFKSKTGKKFDAVIVNGIGGSALGPQLMQFAINGPYWNEFDREKRKNNLKWGLWGLLFYIAYRKPNFYCRKEVIIRFSIG